MSVLRDALKKAERAQEEARQQAVAQQWSLEPAPAPGALEVDPEASISEAGSIDGRQFAVDAIADEPEATAANERDQDSIQPRSQAPAANSVAAQPLWEPNPRLPFYFAVCALGAGAAGVAGYFWYQLRPQTSGVHATPARTIGSAPAASVKPATTEPLMATTEEALASLPKTQPAASDRQSGPQADETIETPSAQPKAKVAPGQVSKVETLRLPQPSSSAGHSDAAAVHDKLASAALHFSLGNQHARNGHWTQAREAFTKALTGDPENPDFAFNLAVSLDRLHEQREALAQYQQALLLRQNRAANFPAAAARDRVHHLARQGHR